MAGLGMQEHDVTHQLESSGSAICERSPEQNIHQRRNETEKKNKNRDE